MKRFISLCALVSVLALFGADSQDKNKETRITYDNLGRVSSVNGKQLKYDDMGRPLFRKRYDRRDKKIFYEEITYDSMGRVSSAGKSKINYDSMGRVSSAEKIKIDYDSLGRLSHIFPK